MLKSTARAVRNAINAARAGDNYPKLIKYRAIERPHYGYIVYWAADLAKRLKIDRISLLEFGVAGGNGLLNLEMHAKRVSQLTGVSFEIYGFDTGGGLPAPRDYRDVAFFWQSAHYKMDRAALDARLTTAKLVIGDVSETTKDFIEKFNPAPIGAAAFDVDYYSSTMDALKIFDVPSEYRLPRIQCYFDDITGHDLAPIGIGMGMPLAINDFNEANKGSRALSPLRHMEYHYAPAQPWHHRLYNFADFNHPRFNDYILETDNQLPLDT